MRHKGEGTLAHLIPELVITFALGLGNLLVALRALAALAVVLFVVVVLNAHHRLER